MSGKPAAQSVRPVAPNARRTPSSRPPPRVRAPVSEQAESKALLDEVRRACGTLDALLSHAEQLGPLGVADVRTRLSGIRKKLDAQDLCVVLLGEDKPRKAAFVNALLGHILLPGEARTPATLVSVRRAIARHYVARSPSHTFDFDKLHPDRSRDFARKISAAQTELEASVRVRERQTAEVERYRDAAEHAFGELKEQFSAFEATRADAERMAQEIAQQETQRTELDRVASDQERALPQVLRSAPPTWAFWLWIAYGVARLLWLKAFRAWRATLHSVKAVELETSRLQIAASNAALACRVAEAALDPLASPAESSRAGFITARKQLAEIESRVQRLERTIQSTRTQLGNEQVARHQQFEEDVSTFYAGDADGEPVTSLELRHPAEHLPEDVTLLDISGLLARGSEIEERSWAVVSEQADACVFVSEVDAKLPDVTTSRLQRALGLVPHVVLVLTGMDEVYLTALREQSPAAWQHLERLRGVAVLRFAGEVGCAETNLPSLCVPAEAALDEGVPSELVRRFEHEVKRFIQVLRLERSLLLGTRTANLLQESRSSMLEAEQRVERLYEQQIAILEERRRPDPERFLSEQLGAAEPAVRAAAAEITHTLLQLLKTRINGLRAQIVERVLACREPRQLIRAVPDLERLIRTGMESTSGELGREIELRADGAVRSIEIGVFEALRLRYEIGCLVTRASSPS
ncbi:MAG TPA: hypothetical protein VK524_03800, partial [Polyangiaceae bacterium]|nr:hypothetical protein [Polyangiaceae bacterium]